MASTFPMDGYCSERFRTVEEQFRSNFDNGNEVGAAIALYLNGELVIDLWGGFLDAAQQHAWRIDSLVNVWSTTKGVTAACFALAVERGLCMYEDRVARYWPEFAAGGKEDVTIGELLSHQAGLSAFEAPLSVENFADTDGLADRLARQAPLWQPGTQSGYHAITVGFLATGLFRRIEGRSLATFVEQEMAAIDLHIGITDQDYERIAAIVPPAGMNAEGVVPDLSPLQAATLGNPLLEPEAANTATWRKSEIPSANGFANARGLASLYSSLMLGMPESTLRLSPETLDMATKVRWSGVDAVLSLEANWAAGFLRNSLGIYGPLPCAFGHSGWGGSFAFADPENGLAFAYVMNAMGTELVGDKRAVSLVDAVYQSI